MEGTKQGSKQLPWKKTGIASANLICYACMVRILSEVPLHAGSTNSTKQLPGHSRFMLDSGQSRFAHTERISRQSCPPAMPSKPLAPWCGGVGQRIGARGPWLWDLLLLRQQRWSSGSGRWLPAESSSQCTTSSTLTPTSWYRLTRLQYIFTIFHYDNIYIYIYVSL